MTILREMTPKSSALVAFFALTFLFSWSLWLPQVALEAGFETGIVPADGALEAVASLPEVGAFGPAVAAFVLVGISRGRSGIVRLLKRAVDRSFDRRWFVPILVLFPAVAVIGVGVSLAFGGEPTYPWAGELPALPIAFIWILFLGGPLQEEFGWRGYALEPLLERFGALGGSLGLGFVWGVWHLPWFYMPTMDLYYQRPLIGFVITITLLSVVMTWVYANTGGSLLAMLLMHASFNWALWAFPAIETGAGGQAFIFFMLVIVAVIVVRHGTSDFGTPRTTADSTS
ncbi:CPBP family intramembrane glutamic endopeptidase [Natronosalvus amylolyticus]|uniref:CPBP family intramembrane glutamic endopeptidase n=1 Tax=Natronosalvus amylolyticus TaxID=2961994 RepID=UPI0020CA033F|nr:type II CAAX endopeptidase family protein [Natronosalvus amylolyticus]